MSHARKNDLTELKKLLAFIKENDLSCEITQKFGGQPMTVKNPRIIDILIKGISDSAQDENSVEKRERANS